MKHKKDFLNITSSSTNFPKYHPTEFSNWSIITKRSPFSQLTNKIMLENQKFQQRYTSEELRELDW